MFSRDQLKITLKIFLHDFDVSSLLAAVQAALRKLSTNRVDSLFLATPVEAIPLLGIGSGAVGPDQQEATEHLLGLWRGVEQLIGEGKVGGAGLCDLHPPVFFSIYEQATVKPTSVQVIAMIRNMKTLFPGQLEELLRGSGGAELLRQV